MHSIRPEAVMSISTLTAETFDEAVAQSDVLVIELLSSGGGVLEAVAPRAPEARYARVDTVAQPAVAAMFGLSAGPGLLIFREKVVLYLETGEHTAQRVEELVRRVQALDMDAVRAAIEEEKQAETALRMRRVCPAARRGRLSE
jgi:thioredoxin 1